MKSVALGGLALTPLEISNLFLRGITRSFVIDPQKCHWLCFSLPIPAYVEGFLKILD